MSAYVSAQRMETGRGDLCQVIVVWSLNVDSVLISVNDNCATQTFKQHLVRIIARYLVFTIDKRSSCCELMKPCHFLMGTLCCDLTLYNDQYHNTKLGNTILQSREGVIHWLVRSQQY